MKLSLVLCRFILLALAPSTLALPSSSNSICTESGPETDYDYSLFPPTTRFGGGDPPPPPPPPPPRRNNDVKPIHSYTKITLKNDTGRCLRIYTQFHIAGRWQPRPEANPPAIVPPGQAYSPVIIPNATKDKDKVVTGKNFMMIVVADGKIWNPKSRFFQSLNSGAKYEYKEVIMNDGTEFTYPITEANPSPQPWIFPIPNWQ